MQAGGGIPRLRRRAAPEQAPLADSTLPTVEISAIDSAVFDEIIKSFTTTSQVEQEDAQGQDKILVDL